MSAYRLPGAPRIRSATRLDQAPSPGLRPSDASHEHPSDCARLGGDECDLGELTFLDVTGLRALLEIRDRVAKAGGRLVVRALDSDHSPVAAVLGLDQSLTVLAPGRRGEGRSGPRG